MKTNKEPLKSVEEIVEERWHNWKEDPEFWKKDIIDVLHSYTTSREREVREDERKNMYKMPDGKTPEVIFIGMYRDGIYHQEALTTPDKTK